MPIHAAASVEEGAEHAIGMSYEIAITRVLGRLRAVEEIAANLVDSAENLRPSWSITLVPTQWLNPDVFSTAGREEGFAIHLPEGVAT